MQWKLSFKAEFNYIIMLKEVRYSESTVLPLFLELAEHIVHLLLCDDNIFLLLIYFMCGKAKLSDLLFLLTEHSAF